MLRLLDKMGKDYLRQPEDLKYLLSPILAKNVEQQELFYTLFDNYLEEIQQPFPQPPPLLPWYEKIPRWVYGLIVLSLLALLAYFIYNNQPGPVPQLHFTHDKIVSTGDTVVFTNQSTDLHQNQDLMD